MEFSWTAFLIAFMAQVFISHGNDLAKELLNNGLIPDVLPVSCNSLANVTYGTAALNIKDGLDELTPSQVKIMPEISWMAHPNNYYAIIMVDPDAPSRDNPVRREILHWLVTNIPGNEVGKGDVLAEYTGSKPPQDSGLHRYVFIVYQQPGKMKLDFQPITLDSRSSGRRARFSARGFALKHGFMETPVACNAFQAQFEPNGRFTNSIHQSSSSTGDKNSPSSSPSIIRYSLMAYLLIQCLLSLATPA